MRTLLLFAIPLVSSACAEGRPSASNDDSGTSIDGGGSGTDGGGSGTDGGGSGTDGGGSGTDTGMPDMSFPPTLCESCGAGNGCDDGLSCEEINASTGQSACLPSCPTGEFALCPVGFGCIGNVCVPTRGCCVAENVGNRCTGEGECGVGRIECDSETGGAVCSTEPGGSADASSPELCDGLDNDCDGEVDENFNVGDRCSGVGECRDGNIECLSPTQAVCSTSPDGSDYNGTPDTSCDGEDDDCDGATDEDYVGTPCEGRGACGAGVLECIDGLRGPERICSTEQFGSMSQVADEICDGADNDCNGTIDDGFGVGTFCTAQGICGTGGRICNADGTGTICDSTLNAIAETCNGLDDDCNGVRDDPFVAQLGLPCFLPGVCTTATTACSANGLEVTCSSPQQQTEICDGADNNCNGATDEGFGVGNACSTGQAGVCAAGTLQCAPGGTSCARITAPSAEICNSLDDNCDGVVNNGCPVSFLVGVPALTPQTMGTFNNGFTLNCAPGQVVSGVFGRQGSDLDQIGLRCQTLSLVANMSNPALYSYDILPVGAVAQVGPQGGDGGGAFSYDCPEGRVVRALNGRDTSQQNLQMVQFACDDLLITQTSTGYTLTINGVSVLSPTFGEDVVVDEFTSCPPGSIATGVIGGRRMESTARVDGLRLNCTPITEVVRQLPL